jgi:hypothetical protein
MIEQTPFRPDSMLKEKIAKALGWEQLMDDTGWWRDTSCKERLLPNWSTNDALAIQLLQKLCKPVEDGGRGWSGYRIHYECYGDYGEHTVVILLSFEGDTVDMSSLESLAHAISLAILAALEDE